MAVAYSAAIAINAQGKTDCPPGFRHFFGRKGSNYSPEFGFLDCLDMVEVDSAVLGHAILRANDDF